MKISYQFFPEVNLLFQKFSGEPSVDEYINYAQEILRKNNLVFTSVFDRR